MDAVGVEHMRIIRTTEAPRWLQNADGATLGIGEYYDTMFEFLRAYIKERHKMSVDIWQVVQVYPEIRSYRARPVECSEGEYRDSIPVCRGNRAMVAVDANGDVVPCHQLSGYYASHGLYIGNVKRRAYSHFCRRGSISTRYVQIWGNLRRPIKSALHAGISDIVQADAERSHLLLRMTGLARTCQNVNFSKRVITIS